MVIKYFINHLSLHYNHKNSLTGNSTTGSVLDIIKNVKLQCTQSSLQTIQELMHDNKVTHSAKFCQAKLKEEGTTWHLSGLNLSITYTEMVNLVPHSCLFSGSEVHDLKCCTSMR